MTAPGVGNNGERVFIRLGPPPEEGNQFVVAGAPQSYSPEVRARLEVEAKEIIGRYPGSKFVPEAWYRIGALMAYCGQKEPSLRLLKAAVQQNYCAYSALLDDPLLKDLRKETAFSEVLTAASACQATLKEGR